MANLSDYAEKLLLDWMLTTGTATRPTAWYIALYTTSTDDASGGTEVTGNNYARQPVTFAAASSPAGSTSNTADVVFNAVGGDWGTIVDARIMTASTAGNSLFHGVLDDPQTVLDGNSLTFLAGDIVPSLA